MESEIPPKFDSMKEWHFLYFKKSEGLLSKIHMQAIGYSSAFNLLQKPFCYRFGWCRIAIILFQSDPYGGI